MPFPLYTLPEGEEYEKDIYPSPYAYGGYTYSPPWKEEPLMAKIIGVIMFALFFPPMWGLYIIIWMLFFE